MKDNIKFTVEQLKSMPKFSTWKDDHIADFVKWLNGNIHTKADKNPEIYLTAYIRDHEDGW